MKCLIQRVKEANVSIEGSIVGQIEQGLVVFLGITHTDTHEMIPHFVRKLTEMRIFSDSDEKMNLSLQDIKGSILLISQFTLYGDASKGRRPSFIKAARPEHAEPIYNAFLSQLSTQVPTASGQFGADMQVSILNDGPVTLLLE